MTKIQESHLIGGVRKDSQRKHVSFLDRMNCISIRGDVLKQESEGKEQRFDRHVK